MGREVTMNVSSEIAWGIIRDNSCFLLKKRGVKKPFSTEACNLTNRNAMRYNGLVNTKAVGVSAAADNKGFVVTTKRAKPSQDQGKPEQAEVQEGPDQGRHEEGRCHCQVTEATAQEERLQDCGGQEGIRKETSGILRVCKLNSLT